jgi:hypothetical protein
MSNNKQQTAVDDFWFEIGDIFRYTVDINTGIRLLKAYERAKIKEREHLIKAHGIKFDYSHSQIHPKKITGEEYYNETYGGNK